MGQKTHPKGLRLEVNKNWTSNWFPKKNAFFFGNQLDVQFLLTSNLSPFGCVFCPINFIL